MSLEIAIAALTAAVEANTKALAGVKTATGTPAKTAPKPAAYKPQHTKDEMKAACKAHKAATSLDDTKALIMETTGIEGMDNVNDPELIDKLFDAATAATAAAAAGADDGM